MSATELQQITAFRAAFARRQADEAREVDGGVVVLDAEFARSHEHNQLVVDGTPEPAALLALADAALGGRRHRQVTVLDDAVGADCVPAFTAAGYAHDVELVMLLDPGAAAAATARSTALAAAPVGIDDLRPALSRQLRSWMPAADEETIRQLVDRRRARRRGADQVLFLGSRDADGEVACSADLYLDPVRQIAQIEDLVTVDTRTRRGHADAVLTAALHRAAGYEPVFLLAAADDWPQTWYARRGFRTIGRSHVFSRAA